MWDTVLDYLKSREKADADKIIEQMSEINLDAAKAFAATDKVAWESIIRAGDEA